MRILFSLFLLFAVSFTPAIAQSVNPTANSVKEDQLLKALKDDAGVAGRASIPDAKAATLIRPQGGEWAAFNQGTSAKIGGFAILAMLIGLVVFYLTRGKITIKGGASGKTILRFNSLERANHWMTATTFILLGLSGLNITFGKTLLLPIIGAEAFSSLSAFFKLCHNYLAWPFILGIIVMFLLWVKDNIPSKIDIAWFKAGGGIIGDKHVDSKRFNGGQKVVFWTVVLGGGLLAWSGLTLLFPASSVMSTLLTASTVHAIVGGVMVAIMIAHIYIGSVGMEGASNAMTDGQVDLNWAKEHHNLWVKEVQASAKATPAE